MAAAAVSQCMVDGRCSAGFEDDDMTHTGCFRGSTTSTHSHNTPQQSTAHWQSGGIVAHVCISFSIMAVANFAVLLPSPLQVRKLPQPPPVEVLMVDQGNIVLSH